MTMTYTLKNTRQLALGIGAFCVMSVLQTTTVLAADVPLNEETHINQTLLSAAIGKLIVDNCQNMSARVFLALSKASQLKDYALDKGYSEDEIDAFISDRREKKRMRREARAYLLANGVVVGQEQTYCALGTKEIEEKSLTGQLMRAW